MEPLSIEGTTSTPRIRFLDDRGILEISGESYPENSFEFYRPFLDWLDRLLSGLTAPLTLRVDIPYMNSSSTKCVLDMLDSLEAAHRRGVQVAVEWIYDEDNPRALDVAEEFREEVTLPFSVHRSRGDSGGVG